MSVVRLPDAARVSVAEAKRLLSEAFPREDGMDVYVDAAGEYHFKFNADANPQAFYLEHDFADTCKQLGIKPRFRLRPLITSYRGPEDDDLYVITRDELAALAGLFGIKVSTQDPAPALEQAPQAAEVEWFVPRFERLTPRTPWAGGRMVDTDVLTLADAAAMATKHAGEPVTIGDFLRAAARGEITLRAIVHHTAKVQAHYGGIFCNAGQENENKVPAGAIPTLPLTACQHLAAAGRASWRTFDGFETVNGGLQRYTAGQLVAGEPDFETVPEDCRVVGYDVHALADEYTVPKTQQAEPSGAAPAAGEPDASECRPLQRFPAQEARVLAVIREMGHEPERLPPRAAGRPWVKSEAWAAIGVCTLFSSEKVFEKAWERLRERGAIRERAGL